MGASEQEAEKWWEGFLNCLDSLSKGCKAYGYTGGLERTEALGITHQRGTVVPVDNAGGPLAPAMCDSDIRCWPQIEEAQRTGEWTELYEQTGSPPFPFVGIYKIAWFRENRREVFESARGWYSPQDYIIRKLTGQERISAGSLSRLGLLDIRSCSAPAQFAQEWAGIEYPYDEKVYEVGTVIGEVGGKEVSSFGLSPNTRIVACAGDQASALAAIGAHEEGDIGINLGTSFVASAVANRPVFNTEAMWTVEVSADGKWLLDVGSGCGSNVLDWFARTTGYGKEMNWARLGEAATEFVGSLSAPVVVPLWWKALGRTHYGAILGLDQSTETPELYLSILEGLSFETKQSIEGLFEKLSFEPKQFYAFGGVAGDALFTRLLANVLEQPLSLPANVDASAMGAAATAAVGMKMSDSLEYFTRSFRSTEVKMPSERNKTYWSRKYAFYNRVRETLPSIEFDVEEGEKYEI